MTIYERLEKEEKKLRLYESCLNGEIQNIEYCDETNTVNDYDFTITKDQKYTEQTRMIIIERDNGKRKKYIFAEKVIGAMRDKGYAPYDTIGLLIEAQEGIEKQKTLVERMRFQAKCISEIMNFLESRGVKHLVHFTPTRNLDSIATYGIVPVAKQKEMGIDSIKTDYSRIDDKSNNNFSITYPNIGMLNAKKRYNNFAILKVRIEVLVDENMIGKVMFSNHNATYNGSVKGSEIKYLKNMFENESTYYGKTVTRSADIPDNNTTDFQAEVLIGNTVPVEYIDSIEIEKWNGNGYVLATHAFPGKTVNISDELFINRSDINIWRRERTNGYQTSLYHDFF